MPFADDALMATGRSLGSWQCHLAPSGGRGCLRWSECPVWECSSSSMELEWEGEAKEGGTLSLS